MMCLAGHPENLLRLSARCQWAAPLFELPEIEPAIIRMERRMGGLDILKHLLALVQLAGPFFAVEDLHFGLVKIRVAGPDIVPDRFEADDRVALPRHSVP